MTKSPGRSYDLCTKSAKVRAKMYRKKSIKKQRSKMCGPGKSPRCVKGVSYCVKKASRKGRKSKSKKLLM